MKKDKKMQEYLRKQKIKWKFNLSKGRRWGWQFERRVGLVKQSLFKATGRTNLTKKNLEGVIEIVLNN